ncbi:TetR/AcrR family transcriptional regulator [Alteromonas facilis]|uniref:TetR/AcrR family transcriptional regulator n=1 Tax=Alteromonas facilis TaxID=2048004 RepID=UPI000C286151|nr:TetR/AcrR family transcriptional regulator [Alteromonas facilis]
MTTKKRSEIKREAILEGARRAFQQFGVSHTSMDKIAELAQVSKRTVYNHFPSKELLVTHIVKDIWGKSVLGFDAPYDPNRDLKSQLMNLVDNQLSLMGQAEMLELTRVALAHCLYSPENFEDEIADFFDQETAMIRWLKHAMEDGKLKRVEPRVANEQILSLLKGQALWPQLLHAMPALNAEQKAVLAEQTVDMFLSYYQL